MLARVRRFFQERSVTEVDCPLIAPSAVDPAIEPIPATYAGSETRYLITSPEFSMKRLLCEGMGDIYQLSHVFRDGEQGSRHNPEFTMAEWYRIGFSLDQMIEETAAFAALFVGEKPLSRLTYRDVFERHAAIALDAPAQQLLEALKVHELEPYAGWEKEGPTALIDMLYATAVEPHLGKDGFTAIVDFPQYKAELARVSPDGAERFELYLDGYELANGYGELTDAGEHRRRFTENNRQRRALDKVELPISEHFLSALEQGLPDCCGVAVGFDRLMMLRHGVDSIKEILPFAWAS